MSSRVPFHTAGGARIKEEEVDTGRRYRVPNFIKSKRDGHEAHGKLYADCLVQVCTERRPEVRHERLIPCSGSGSSFPQKTPVHSRSSIRRMIFKALHKIDEETDSARWGCESFTPCLISPCDNCGENSIPRGSNKKQITCIAERQVRSDIIAAEVPYVRTQ